VSPVFFSLIRKEQPMPETIDFKISEIPELDETGMEALEEVFAHIKVIPSDKPRLV